MTYFVLKIFHILRIVFVFHIIRIMSYTLNWKYFTVFSINKLSFNFSISKLQLSYNLLISISFKFKSKLLTLVSFLTQIIPKTFRHILRIENISQFLSHVSNLSCYCNDIYRLFLYIVDVMRWCFPIQKSGSSNDMRRKEGNWGGGKYSSRKTTSLCMDK